MPRTLIKLSAAGHQANFPGPGNVTLVKDGKDGRLGFPLRVFNSVLQLSENFFVCRSEHRVSELGQTGIET
jgi:hypothetical protein